MRKIKLTVNNVDKIPNEYIDSRQPPKLSFREAACRVEEELKPAKSTF